jgi:hypothetical protein
VHRRRLPLAGAIALVLALAAPALAHDSPPTGDEPVAPVDHVDVGIGDNRGAFFNDENFAAMGFRNVRLTVPYDLVRARGWRLHYADAWLQAAKDRGLDVLISFGFSNRRGLRWHLPSIREYRKRVREFMDRYPWVHEYTTWNEANHKRVQPTGKHPIRTAMLYRTLRTLCREPGCTTVAADILLTGSRRTWRWIKAFKRRAHTPKVWGVHNYPDANRMSSRQTRRFLRTVSGEVWFTETGGIVRFGRTWKPNERRAARALHHVFRLAELSPRVKRIYLYSWRGTRTNRRWDSGLISPAGRLRAGFHAVVDELTLDRFNPKTPALQPPPANAPPVPETDPAPEP